MNHMNQNLEDDMFPQIFKIQRYTKRVAITFFTVLAVLAGSNSWAGSYVFVKESRVNTVTHPTGYTGTGTILNVKVCIDAASQDANALVIPVKNNITVWNNLQPVLGNLKTGGLPSGEVDAESVTLHEIGHCIGLGHVNLASESELSGDNRNYTKSTAGADGSYGLNAGSDGVRGSADDIRGDDVNLHWFNPDNDPFTVPIHTPVDSTLYSRNTANLPTSDNWVVNADRDVSLAMGYSYTESVMQQGSFYSELQRELVSDDVTTVMYAESGVDELSGTSDDYQVVLTYGGIVADAATNCDISVTISGSSFAHCSTGGTRFSGDHIRITSANVFLGTGYNWHFNTQLLGPSDTTPPTPNPMSWDTLPTAVDASSITMTATTATDDSGSVEYQFVCQSGGSGCVSSPWQTSSSYTATGLDSNTPYTYVVRARDTKTNTTDDSSTASATTAIPPPVTSITLPYSEDFSDGQAQNFVPTSNEWGVSSGAYEVNTTQNPSLATFNYDFSSQANLVVGAKIKGLAGGTWQNSYIVFDYKSPTDYKFAGGFFGSDNWRIGHNTGNGVSGTNYFETIDEGVVYDVEVVLNGGIATLYVGGVEKVSVDFATNLLDGKVGLGASLAITTFDDFRVTTQSTANIAPIVDFSFTETDLKVNFSDGSSDSAGGTITNWAWSFGDGGASTIQNPSYIYGSAGTYSVTLTVTDNDGATNSTTQPVTVTTPDVDVPPVAPTNLTALVQTSGKGRTKIKNVTLNWVDSSDNETTFVIERCEETGKGKSKSCDFPDNTEYDSVGENIETFSDDALSGTFKYRVKARNATGDSSYSNVVKI